MKISSERLELSFHKQTDNSSPKAV